MLVRRISKWFYGLGFLLAIPTARADLAQLADAYADVATFGAWGQSRNQHEAEIELLKARFAEQLQREKNVGQAMVSTVRIEEKAKAAMFAQYIGQQLLLITGTVEVLMAQMNQLVVDRAKTQAVSSNFNEWFDSFVEGQDEQLKALVELLKQMAPQDDKAIDMAVKSALIASAKAKDDSVEARKRLRDAVSGARINSLTESMGTLADIQRQLKKVIEENRNRIRSLIVEMDAEDVARRQLCKPSDTLGVACVDGNCSYYSPDRAKPLPCNDITYLNAFPVSAIRRIVDNLDAYKEYVEFYVKLDQLGTSRKITTDSFRSPEEVYGVDLTPAILVPGDFSRPATRCQDIDKYSLRLREAFSIIALFGAATDRPAATLDNVKFAISLQPIIDFWLQDLSDAAPATGGCSGMPNALRSKLKLLMAAVAAIESFGDALIIGPHEQTNDRQSLADLEKVAHAF